jgi:hypothetical protein
LVRKSFGQDVADSPGLPTIEDVPETGHSPSPDLRPQGALPIYVQNATGPIRERIKFIVRLHCTNSISSGRSSGQFLDS